MNFTLELSIVFMLGILTSLFSGTITINPFDNSQYRVLTY